MKLKNKLPLATDLAHCILFGIYPVLALYAHNINELEFRVIFLPALVTAVCALLLWAVVSFALKDIKKAGIFVSLFLIFFFSYGHIINAIEKTIASGFIVDMDVYPTLVWLLILIVLIYIIFKKMRDNQSARKVTGLFNTIAVFLVIISIGRITFHHLTSRPAWQEIPPTKLEEKIKQAVPKKETVSPDIYYIIFDRYASAQTLKNYYGYDNSEFVDFLTKKGFYVANQSRANYPITDLSLASSLNMEFLDSLSMAMGEESRNFVPINKKIADFNVWRFLQKKGYTYIHMGSTWWLTSKNPNADINYKLVRTLPLSTFFIKLLETTMLVPLYSADMLQGEQGIIKDSGWPIKNLSYKILSRDTALDQLEKLTKIRTPAGPKFVFAHILLPHEPHVFDRDGNFIPGGKKGLKGRRQHYIEQLIYTNKLIKTMVEKLLANTKGQAVIVLQADEGPLPPRYKANESSFQWRQATVDELREKLEILNAYYLPNVAKSGLYPAITPVNTFRLIFNHYFQAGLPLLPDETYVTQDKEHPYKYFNVTEKVKYE